MSTAANPKADQLNLSGAPQEPTGPVAKDSLAAESIQSAGAFADNENAAVLGVKGANSTLNTTDTSGATVLPAAQDSVERAQEEAKGLGSDEKGVTGAKIDTLGNAEFSGTHSSEGYVGGATHPSSSITGDSNLPSGATGDSFADGAGATASSDTTSKVSSGADAGTSGADDAPNYAATVSGALRPEGEDKPKGNNLTEGGVPETKTFTGAVGGPNDPGRLAEQEFTKVGPGGAAPGGEAITQGDGGNQFTGGSFDVLSSERA